MPLAVAKVESLIRCFPGIAHLRDDLTSAAFIGLVKAVNKMAAGKGPTQQSTFRPGGFHRHVDQPGVGTVEGR